MSVIGANPNPSGGARWGYLADRYSPEGQEIAARNFYRPTDPQVAAKYARNFPP